MKGLTPKTPQQHLDAKVFAAANYTGATLARMDDMNMFMNMSEIIATVCALNGLDAPISEVMSVLVDQIVDSYGYLRPEEIRVALTSALMGKIPEAQRTFSRINLEWIGGVLSAYEKMKPECLARVKARLPEIEARDQKTEAQRRADAEADFWQMVKDIYYSDQITKSDSKVLPEVFQALDEYAKSHNIERISPERRAEIYSLAGDILEKRDERAAEYAATQSDFFTAQILNSSNNRTKDIRRVRLSREIACKEMIAKMKRKGIEL